MQDTLSASTAMLTHFSNALAQYAAHEQSIREHMKSIRSREEALDELKRRRKSVGAKADTAEKRLSKMSSEHKSLQVQTDTLQKLRDEMRALDSEIMSEEARLGDFKRTSTRAFMGLKFGGLQELCSKGTIAGDFGMQVIAEVPEDSESSLGVYHKQSAYSCQSYSARAPPELLWWTWQNGMVCYGSAAACKRSPILRCSGPIRPSLHRCSRRLRPPVWYHDANYLRLCIPRQLHAR